MIKKKLGWITVVTLLGVICLTAWATRENKSCCGDSSSEQDWWCIVEVVDQIPKAWLYKWKNCRTWQTFEEWDEPGLPVGDCINPDGSGSSCVQGIVIGSVKKKSN